MLKGFDLDGTVLDSSHRKASLPDGQIDLPHWIANNTPEQAAKDTTLPLVHTMRQHWKEGHTIIVCTARVLADHDYGFFLENDIPFHHMLSRPEGCTMADHELKDIMLRLYAQEQGHTWAQFCNMFIMYDDCQKVINRLVHIGIDTLDANQQNRLLRWAV